MEGGGGTENTDRDRTVDWFCNLTMKAAGISNTSRLFLMVPLSGVSYADCLLYTG